jgi:hypothetical protein
MVEESVAKLLLAAAERDRQAFRALVAIPEMNDAVIGFHAHQVSGEGIEGHPGACGHPLPAHA